MSNSQTMEKVARQGGVKSPEFRNHEYGDSHWYPTLNYHGNGLARQHGDPVKSGEK